MVLILGLSGLIQANKYYGEVKVAYLFPTDEVFKDVYKGGILTQLEFGMKVMDQLEVGVNVGYFGKTGELTFTKEETKISIISFELDTKYLFMTGDFVPYAGVVLNYNLYQEESDTMGKLDHSGVGFGAVVGGYYHFSESMALDLFVNYKYCQMKPEEIEFNIGGIKAGIGLKFNF